MGRKHASIPRSPYTFRLISANVEKVRQKVPNLSEWVDRQFEHEATTMDWTDEAKMTWRRWLAVQSDAIREVAILLPPTKLYTSSSSPSDRYTIRSYDHNSDGTVTLTLMREDGSGTVHGVPPHQVQHAN